MTAPGAVQPTRGRNSQTYWNLIFLALLGGGLFILAVFIFSPDWLNTSRSLPVSLHSSFKANYAADLRGLRPLAISLGLVGDAARDRALAQEDPGDPLASLLIALQTPVPTATPLPTRPAVQPPTVTPTPPAIPTAESVQPSFTWTVTPVTPSPTNTLQPSQTPTPSPTMTPSRTLRLTITRTRTAIVLPSLQPPSATPTSGLPSATLPPAYSPTPTRTLPPPPTPTRTLPPPPTPTRTSPPPTATQPPAPTGYPPPSTPDPTWPVYP